MVPLIAFQVDTNMHCYNKLPIIAQPSKQTA